ncbi:MAG: helix-turn-helix domain-containing protein [Clostridia bacterium]|nr:helix-turn-helix domain-containing protein [Clostridia bacterium]
MDFKERLKDLRTESKMTQKQLAQKINVTDDCIYFWEKGRSEPSISQIIELADLFEVSCDYLLGKSEY